MGTLNDKIHYLQDTKDDIKDAIVAQGISVASTDTFRSYADKISQIQGGGAVYTAGDNVQIENNVISATDTTYTAGDGIEISASNIISTNALPDGTPIYYVNNTDTTQTAFITSITPTLNQMYADVRNNLQPQLYLTTTYKYLDTDSINGLYSFNQNYIASGNYMLQNSNKWNLNTMSADSYNTMQLETHAFIASITTPGTVDSWLDVPLSQTGGATYFLNPTTTYTTPFIPTDAGHPATKKYVDDNVYTLPTASTTVLGGVKVDGTSISITDGVISSANTLAKASGSDINTGTDDTKYITSKAVTDSKISITDHTETLTNKAIVKRVVTTTDDATAVIDVGVTDIYELSAIANATTFSTTGSPTDGQKLMIRFKDAGTAKALTWDTVFVAIGVTAPTTTVAGKWHYVGCEYNAAATKWHILAVAVQA